MLQNPCKTLGFKKIMVYEIPPGGDKAYSTSGLVATERVVHRSVFRLNIGQCGYYSS